MNSQAALGDPPPAEESSDLPRAATPGAAQRLSPRTRYVLWRIGVLLISLWALITAAFLLIRLIPGDAVRAMLGPNVAPEAVEAKRHELGLDGPVYQQYYDFIVGLLHGDLGNSSTLRTPVASIIASRLPVTLTLAGISIIVILVLSLLLGFYFAVKTQNAPGSRTEVGFIGVTGFLHTIPEFVLGVVLVYILSVSLGWLPVAGIDSVSGYVLPIAALSIGNVAGLGRIVRVEALRVLDADYIRTARSKRLPRMLIYVRHAFPNVITAVLTIGGLALSGLLSGTVVVENVFALPGLGTTIVEAIQANDFPLIQGTVLVLGGFVLFINFAIDLIISRFNPQSRIA